MTDPAAAPVGSAGKPADLVLEGGGVKGIGLAGAVSARLGGSSIRRAVLRLVIGGALGLALTYGIGHLFGTAIG